MTSRNSRSTRRGFLGGAALLGASLAVVPKVRGLGVRSPTSGSPTAASVGHAPAIAASDDIAQRITALKTLSRDAEGRVHVASAAFIEPGLGARGTLALTASEVTRLVSALGVAAAKGDLTPYFEHGFHLAGERFVLIQIHDEGTVLHLMRPGMFATVRAAPDVIVVATSTRDMAHGRAVEAIYQLLARTTPAGRIDAG